MKVHFLGIGGSGASAAAAIAKAQGFVVTGCDLEPHNEFTAVFVKNQLYVGHSASHLTGGNVNILAVTPAIFSLDPKNPELLKAHEIGIPIMTWQRFVGEYLAKDKFVVAICGTHGKTTTCAMIAKILEDANLDPTVLLGAILPKWKRNFRIGKGRYFVIEADEFNDNFLSYKPNISVVTNIEMDHPEYFKDFDAYKNNFKKFLGQTTEKIIANLSDRGVQEVLASSDVPCQGWQTQIMNYSQKLINFSLKVPGEFNILNASAAFKVGIELGIDPEIIKKSLMSFTGAERRFEKIGEFKGAAVYSDFAHHPTEIEVTLEAVREKFPDKKIIVVFQPHMFSRTKALFNDFVKVFKQVPVEQIFILDIFPSREIDTGLVNSKQLVDAINQNSSIQAQYVPIDQILEKVEQDMLPNEVLFFMGAGETHKLGKRLIKG